MIKKLHSKFKRTESGGMFHNSREDVAQLAKFCNMLTDKVNETIDKVNELEAKLQKKEDTQ